MPYILMFLMVAASSIGVGGYFYISDLQEDLAQARLEAQTYKIATEEQSRTIDTLQTTMQTQGVELNRLNEANGEIQAEVNRYLSIFKRHNLSRLADAKPGLIETRANNGTKAVFETIRNDTTVIVD